MAMWQAVGLMRSTGTGYDFTVTKLRAKTVVTFKKIFREALAED
jgi:hypothetical protein